jgi:prepilin-type N-terminal cleavage/methylation domain-containing protein
MNFKEVYLMVSRKGFSFIEILIAIVIMGVVLLFTIPNLMTSIKQSKAQVAKNNLLAISAAQQKYSEDRGSYCIAALCNNTANIDTNLSLSIPSNDPFTYSCSNASLPYQCQAVANDASVTLTLTTTQGAVVTCPVGNIYCPS